MNLVNYKNSSFFPSWKPNVLMKEDDNMEESIIDFSTMDMDVADSVSLNFSIYILMLYKNPNSL